MKLLSYIFIIGIVLTSFYSISGTDVYSTRIENTELIQSIGIEKTLYDLEYFTMLNTPNFETTIFKNKAISNTVSFGFRSNVVLPSIVFTCTLKVQLDYKVWNGVGFSFVSEIKDLIINNNVSLSGTIVKESIYKFTGASKVTAKILSMTSSQPVTNLESYVYFENRMDVERYYIKPSNLQISNCVVSQPYMSDNLLLKWETAKGAEYYELEYTYVDDYTTTQGVYKASNLCSYNFYKNSTRVSLKENNYTLPRLYDHGYLIYRVRPVYKKLENQEFVLDEGDWNLGESGEVSSVSSEKVFAFTTDYSSGLNWFVEHLFSEEGRLVSNLSYVDGLGRKRQGIVSNPETNQKLYSNIYYDEQGRPTVNDLPTPLSQNTFHHINDFNRLDNSNQDPYGVSYFDVISLSNCNYSSSVGFSTNYGAGKYYSENNLSNDPIIGSQANANRFPFSGVRYMNDFTGRVSKVNQPGDAFTMSSGHETTYYYPSPNQNELNRLFGIEAGNSSHYQKLITKDGNGQLTASYLDLAGRTVVSYLMGDAPINVTPITTDAPIEDEIQLLTNGNVQNIDLSNQVATLTFSEFITTAQTYTFDYGFTSGQYSSICNAVNLCFDCVYKLKFQIIDNCGVVIYNQSQSINGATLDNVCNGSTAQSLSFMVPLTQGMYDIVKSLELDQSVIPTYWCKFIDQNECLPSISSAFNLYYNQEQFESCTNELPSNSGSECDEYRAAMIADLSPGGQYASYDINSSGLVISSNNPYSIFTPNNLLGVNWTYPPSPYLNELGQDITSFLVGQGIIYFVTNFRSQWAEVWLASHPEKCLLENCYQFSPTTSVNYDNALSSIYEFTVANNAGYFKPVTGITIPSYLTSGSNSSFHYYINNSVSSLDPFFDDPVNASLKTQLIQRLQNYITINGQNLSLWEYVYYLKLNLSPSFSITSSISQEISKSNQSDCTDDQVWVLFRKMYLSLKEEIIENARIEALLQSGCSNECIGNTEAPCSGSSSYLQYHTANFYSTAATQNLVNDNDTEQEITTNNESLTANMSSNQCTEYANAWMESLSGCNISSLLNQSQIDAMLEDFKEICLSGYTASHPVCSTTTPPGQPTASGFEHIDEVLAFYLGPNFRTSLCTELLIDAPGVYQPLSGMEQLSSDLDICACDFLLSAEVAYQEALTNNSLPIGVTNLETWLMVTHLIPMEDVHDMICACKQASTYNYGTKTWSWNPNSIQLLLASKIKVLNDIACKKDCKDCATVQALLPNLFSLFSVSNLTDFNNLTNSSEILTNFFNNQFMFHLSFGDYYNFITSCESTSTSPYCTANPLLENWRDMLNIELMRGNLATNGNKLILNNVVYKTSPLKQKGYLTNYSLSIGTSQSTLTMNTKTGPCTFVFSLPSALEIDWIDILSFGSLQTPLTGSCSGNSTFSLEVFYLKCGELTSSYIPVTTSCMSVLDCYCGSGLRELCDKISQPYTNDKCYQPDLSIVIQKSLDSYLAQIEDMRLAFEANYKQTCSNAFQTENLKYLGKTKNYQYTLFYYDQSGNLVKTVAPQGVSILSNASNAAINTARAGVVSQTNFPAVTPAIKPVHSFETKYQYNSYNQITSTTNPDQQGETKYFYDYYGRIVASQNPVQLQQNKYAYTLYDDLNRPFEVGVLSLFNENTNLLSAPPTETLFKAADKGLSFQTWITTKDRYEVTRTTYDVSLDPSIASKFANGQQENLRLRVATVANYDAILTVPGYVALNYTSAIHYSYDHFGNVKEQLQDVPMLQPIAQSIKSTQYDYSTYSGEMKAVHYQKGKLDGITHLYRYDALGRLKEASTLRDAANLRNEAYYFYTPLGALARLELGDELVQGQDYFYTLNGWLKGMNSSVLDPSIDLGKDGAGGTSTYGLYHSKIPSDIVSYTLGYYKGDYTAISSGLNSLESAYFTNGAAPTESAFSSQSPSLYNGNIRNLTTSIQGFTTLGTSYQYDQLHRLKQATSYEMTSPFNNTWQGIAATQKYFNSYSYDKNGNITNLVRKDQSGALMDQFTYGYGTTSNRLLNVADAAGITSNTDDIEPGQVANNYQYDLLGQLISDIQEGIVNYNWRLSDRKLRSITGSGTDPDVNFIYNPFGQRVVKIVKPKVNGVVDKQSNWIYTYYSYDANGQVMAVYGCKLDATNASNNQATLKEQHLYGSQRLGMVNKNTLLYQSNTAYTEISSLVQNTYGNTNYELTNHLGNVNAVITDRRFWNTTTLKYEADVEMKNDYYPFGMAMPTRQSPLDYRYGYNGMEVDNEVSDQGNSYTTEFRQYDPRLGRWKSLDPLMAQFPWQSPYCTFDNNPVFYTDPYGLESVNGDPPPTTMPKDAKVGDKSPDGVWEVEETEGGVFEWVKYRDIEEIYVIAKKRTGNENPQGSLKNELNQNNKLMISYGKNASKNILSQHSVNKLGEIASNTGVEKIHINSTVRSPLDQAKVMYDNLENKGTQVGYNTYGQNGDKVVKLYADSKLKKLTKDQIIKLMYNKIMELGPSNVSNHCSDWTKLNTIDININSVPKEFIDECKKMGIKVIYEPQYQCWHLEIKQP